MLRERKELEENLIQTILTSKLKSKKRVVTDIKTHLRNYDIIDAQSWINDPENYIPLLDRRELFLLTEQIFAKTGDLNINPEGYFRETEIDEARQFSGILEQKEREMDFPITIANATIVGNSAYMVTLDIKVINKLIENGLLDYNYELQREAKFRKRKDNRIIIEPTVNARNVKEITQHLLDGTLVPTTLVFNAAIRSAEGGTELIFDPKKMELTIVKNTKLFVVDGWHRCKASQNALQTNPELSFNFAVLITNYSTRNAQQYQAQLAKATPISKTRIQELEANRLSDTVVQQLKSESELKGKISQTNRIHFLNKELVTYNVLSDTVDEQFKLETRADAADIGDYLTEYFNFLISSYPDEFLNHVEDHRKTSLINDNNFFIGYIVLARKMMESDIKPRNVRKYIKEINFDRDNSIWQELGILNENGNIADTNKARKAIRECFEQIQI